VAGDIGTVGTVGSSVYDEGTGTFTVNGSGAGIVTAGTADNFHFARTELTGDGTVTARVVSMSGGNGNWSQAGVMLREGTATGSRHVSSTVRTNQVPGFIRRTTVNGTSVTTTGSTPTLPHWVRVIRTGNEFTAYRSANGTTWTSAGSVTLSLAATLDVGLAVSAAGTTTLATAAFDNVSVTPGTPEIIMDNADVSGVTITGAWTSSTYIPGYVGTDYLHDGNTGKGTKSVRFTPNIPTAGAYQVYGRWTASSVDRATNAPFTVQYSGGTAGPLPQNQQLNNNTWVLIGTYTFAAGTGGYVEISNTGTTQHVIVDAVKFVRQ
jgi:regulation of enolase protein 1 (concanavalin A-like superfamily)